MALDFPHFPRRKPWTPTTQQHPNKHFTTTTAVLSRHESVGEQRFRSPRHRSGEGFSPSRFFFSEASAWLARPRVGFSHKMMVSHDESKETPVKLLMVQKSQPPGIYKTLDFSSWHSIETWLVIDGILMSWLIIIPIWLGSIIPSWWFQPIWKILIRQLGSFHQVGVNIKNIWNHHLGLDPLHYPTNRGLWSLLKWNLFFPLNTSPAWFRWSKNPLYKERSRSKTVLLQKPFNPKNWGENVKNMFVWKNYL